jgi:hypothetical protein
MVAGSGPLNNFYILMTAASGPLEKDVEMMIDRAPWNRIHFKMGAECGLWN